MITCLLIWSCETEQPTPNEPDQIFYTDAQLGFETFTFDNGRAYQQTRIQDGENLVFVFNENRRNVNLTNRGILTLQGESDIPDNVIFVQVPADVNEYSLNLIGLAEYERNDIQIYRDVFDGVYIENLNFTATKINDDQWSVSLSAELSDNGQPFFTISDSGVYTRATID